MTPLRAVIFDWAGTTVDYGSLAPVRTLQRVFASFDLPISEADARRDMGLPKRDHIGKILARRLGKTPAEDEIEELYQRFIPLQFACLGQYSAVIPDAPRVVERMRRRGLKIGSTTGYTRAMLDHLLETSAGEGYSPDCSLSPEEAGAGRPYPFMIYAAAVKLQVYPLAAIVKVGDTVADIEEGLNAGAWSIGVAQTGNMIGLNQAEFEALPPAEQKSRLMGAREKLKSAGAHFVIDTLSELEAVLDEIEASPNAP